MLSIVRDIVYLNIIAYKFQIGSDKYVVRHLTTIYGIHTNI